MLAVLSLPDDQIRNPSPPKQTLQENCFLDEDREDPVVAQRPCPTSAEKVRKTRLSNQERFPIQEIC
jgi:hypothetical protein